MAHRCVAVWVIWRSRTYEPRSVVCVSTKNMFVVRIQSNRFIINIWDMTILFEINKQHMISRVRMPAALIYYHRLIGQSSQIFGCLVDGWTEQHEHTNLVWLLLLLHRNEWRLFLASEYEKKTCNILWNNSLVNANTSASQLLFVARLHLWNID